MFSEVLTSLAPVLVVTAIGFAWVNRGFPFDGKMVSDLVSMIGTPCLVIHAFLKISLDPEVAGRMFASAALLVVLMGCAGWLMLKGTGQSLRAFLPPIMFPNMGNMGLPLSKFAFGDTGLALALVVYATTSILQFSVGAAVASGRFSFRDAARNPALISIAIAFAVRGADLVVPMWLDNTIDTLGRMTIPLMLLSLGAALAQLQISEYGRSVGISIIRIAGGFFAALAIAGALGLTGAEKGVLLVQSSMPASVFSYLFSQRYGNHPAAVASVVFVSTAISFLCLPLIMAVVLAIP